MLRRLVLAFGLGLATAVVAAPAQVSFVWGGEASIAFNPDALAALGVGIRDVVAARERVEGVPGQRHDVSRFSARADSALPVRHEGDAVTGLGAGALRFDGGFVLAWSGGEADLRGFSLRPQAAAPLDLYLFDARGQPWLSADHALYGFSDGTPREFTMRRMNLRVTPHFAAALGRPELAGGVLGSLDLHASTRDEQAAATPSVSCAAPWPGRGRRTDVELMHGSLQGFEDTVYAPRCGLPPLPSGGACTAASTNGRLVLVADASLRNIGETAIAWHGHFSGRHPPYDNDQHPFLIWNLYRIDRDGRIRQIGASGVKHAFWSINKTCGCASSNTFWPGCEDIYSGSSNDNGAGATEQNLAPRSEIIPHEVVWARCGSLWDRDCDGRMDTGSGAQDLYQYRMQVDESDLLPPLAEGAEYLFEYWYLVRGDTNIYNTMGYRRITPRKTGANWSVALAGADGARRNFFLGPAIDRWVDPAAPSAHAMSRELATPRGHARVAVRARDLGDGRWRYQYAVMNLDHAQARVDPAHAAEPDIRLLSNHGFARLRVPLADGVVVSAVRSDDLDADPSNDWRAEVGADALTWTAPASGNTLDWGTLHHFEFIANAAPAAGVLHLADAAIPEEPAPTYTLGLLAPGMAGKADDPSD
jgi:hypothetical protein